MKSFSILNGILASISLVAGIVGIFTQPTNSMNFAFLFLGCIFTVIFLFTQRIIDSINRK